MMKKFFHTLFVGFICLATTSPLLASASAIIKADTFEELNDRLKGLTPTDALGWDCDNTWVIRQELGLYDFEMLRENKAFWQAAGLKAKEEGIYAGLPKGFGGFCYEQLTENKIAPEYALLDTRMLEIHKALSVQGVSTFVCTGLPPHCDKVDFLKEQGFDPGQGYGLEDAVDRLFCRNVSGKFPGWLYARNKAAAMENYMLNRTKDRALKGLPSLTHLVYVDNDLDTLQGIERAFSLEGVSLTLIHWRAQALSLKAQDDAGTLIPKILRGYRTLMGISHVQSDSCASEESVEAPRSPRPGDGCDTHSGDEFDPSQMDFGFENTTLMESPLRGASSQLSIKVEE